MRVVVAVVIGALTLGTGVAQAGIDFGTMPKGCSWTIRYSDGSELTETYLGRKGGKHLTEVKRGNAAVRKTTYDSKGRMIRKDWADGNWETFTPYSCFAEEGACTYRYRNSSGADQKIESATKAKGMGFAVQAGPVGGERYPDEFFETGAFGLMVKNKAANYAARLTEMKNCELGS